jgi:DNA-binding IclR family transcriptional regulator
VTDSGSRILSALQANPDSPAWKLAEEAGLSVNVTTMALHQLRAAGFAERGEDAHGIVVWSAAKPRGAA